jgi:hypothetical protein
MYHPSATDRACPAFHQAPFALWMVALLVIYGVSYDRLSGLEGPLVSLSMSQRVVTGGSRLRMWAQALVYAGSSEDKALARKWVTHRLLALHSSRVP